MELIDVTPNDSIVPVYVEKLNETEQAERDADLAQREVQHLEQLAKAEAKASARASLLSKLEALGITPEELETL